MNENICTSAMCDRPAGDAFLCKICMGRIEHEILAEIPWLIDELNLVVTQQTRYTSQPRGRSAETPMVFHVRASDTLGQLVTALDTTARVIADANGWATPWHDGAGASRWLMKSLTALSLHPASGEMVDGISSWFAASLWVIDRPAARQYLGDCHDYDKPDSAEPCPGKVYGKAGKPDARCDTCGTTWDAQELRDHLLGRLESSILTAAEIVRLSTYLGLDIDREQVRKRINQWGSRGVLAVHPLASDSGAEVAGYRVSEVLALLSRHDTTRRSA